MGGKPNKVKVEGSHGMTVRQLHAFEQTFPGFINAITNQSLPTEQALQNTSNVISPQQQELQYQLFQQYAPLINTIGQQMSSSNAQAQSQSDAAILNGTGKDVSAGLLANQKILDPEYYKNRESIGAGIDTLIKGLGDPNKLTGGERAETERSLNRDRTFSGNAGVNSGIGTVQNAVTFGNALQNRRNNFMSLLGQGSSANMGLKSGVDAFQATTGKPSIPQFGGNQLTGANTTQQTGANVFGLGNAAMGNINSNQQNSNNINANQSDSLDAVQTAFSSY